MCSDRVEGGTWWWIYAYAQVQNSKVIGGHMKIVQEIRKSSSSFGALYIHPSIVPSTLCLSVRTEEDEEEKTKSLNQSRLMTKSPRTSVNKLPPLRSGPNEICTSSPSAFVQMHLTIKQKWISLKGYYFLVVRIYGFMTLLNKSTETCLLDVKVVVKSLLKKFLSRNSKR